MPWPPYQGQVITGEPLDGSAKQLDEFGVKFVEARTKSADHRLTTPAAESRFIQ